VGLDNSREMLSSARARALRDGARCSFIESDMRAFSLDRTFRLIFIARNSLLHLLTADDLVSAFTAIRAHLAPGGVFACDVFNPSPAILARPPGQRFPVIDVDAPGFGHVTVEGTHRYESDQ